MAANHSDKFKRDEVRIALTSGLTRRQVASDLGTGLSTIGKWVRAISEGACPVASRPQSLGLPPASQRTRGRQGNGVDAQGIRQDSLEKDEGAGRVTEGRMFPSFAVPCGSVPDSDFPMSSPWQRRVGVPSFAVPCGSVTDSVFRGRCQVPMIPPAQSLRNRRTRLPAHSQAIGLHHVFPEMPPTNRLKLSEMGRSN